MILPLVQNVALLVALTALYRTLMLRFRQKDLGYHIALGLTFGSGGVIGMMTPMNLMPGIFFDGRIIVLSVAALFGGPVTALISAAMCAGYRAWVGGGGAWVGVATVVESAALGTVFYFLRRRTKGFIPTAWMWALGFAVTVVELGLFLALPDGAGLVVIREVGLIILLMYPATTVVVSALLQDAELQIRDREALRARSAELQKAQDLAQLGGWTWYFSQNRLELSEQAQRVLNLKPQELAGSPEEILTAYVHPDDLPRLLQNTRTSADTPIQAPVEFRVRLPDGSERTIWADTGELVYDANGHPQAIGGVLQDITARRAAEEAASEIETRYRNLFLNSPDAIYINHQGRVALANWACLKLFGAQSEDELIGKDVFDLFHPDCHANIKERVRRLTELGEVVPVLEERVVRLDGSVVDVDVIAAPFVTRQGNDIHVIIRDITERKQMEAALRESHEMLTRIAEQAPGVVYQYRLYPDGRSCFPYASQGIWGIYEVTPEEVREDASVVFTRLHPEDLERVSAEIMESARTLNLFHSEFRVVLPEQGHRWRLSNASPERTEDGGTLWYGIIVDDTERKLAEQKIAAQLDELRRWHSVMLGREKRNIELKKEVNELLRQAGQPPRYVSAQDDAEDET